MRWRLCCLLTALGLYLPFQVQAHEPPRDPDPLSLIYDQKERFISATDSARMLNRAPAIASVITAKQIRDMGARTLLDAIRTLPGIGVMYLDTFTILDAIEVRGLRTESSEKVLILLNGHRLNLPITASAFRTLSEFPLDGVARIEIIRGPGSALYGAGAFLATINIIMQDAGPGTEAALSLGAGNHNATRQSLTLRDRQDKVRLFATYTHFDTNADAQPITQDAAGRSGTTNNWRNQHTGYVHADINHLGLTGFITTQRRGTPLGITGLVDTRTDRVTGQAFAQVSHTRHTDQTDLTADLSMDQDWSDLSWQLDIPGFAATGNPRVKSQTVTGKVHHQSRLPQGHLLTLGTELNHVRQYDVEHFLDGVDVSATFNHNRKVTRRVIALYAQDEWQRSASTVLTVGLRWDDYSDVGSSLNPRLAYVWSPDRSVDLKLLYGHAFRAPSFLELYEKNNPVAVGNPGLKAETMDTAEIGLDWRFNDWGRLSSAAFFNRFRDRIVRTLPLSINAGGADIWGIEAELKADWREMRHGYLSWSWNHTEDKQTGNRLADVPRQRIKAGINWGLFRQRVNGNLGLRRAGRQSRPAGDSRPATKAYTVVDVALNAPAHRHGFDWSFTVRNLLDKRVLDPSLIPGDVPRSGRTWLIEAGHKY